MRYGIQYQRSGPVVRRFPTLEIAQVAARERSTRESRPIYLTDTLLWRNGSDGYIETIGGNHA